jgi:TonB family protein
MIRISARATASAVAALTIWLVGISSPAFCQGGALSHFIAPTYPPLARQAMISGQVVLQVDVAPDGKVVDLKEEASPHPLLLQEAKTTARQWEFQEWPKSRQVTVSIYFGFSGTARECNPTTVVKANFAASTIKVFVTTDGVPTVRP